MDSQQLIDAQFNRAVEIVQSLPKTGPIQTGYEEKLTMYSLYKQATVGNVTTSRPGLFDMLGRAKWDAWAKHRDLDPYEAKCLYVDALLKTLGKYSDKTAARDLIVELQSYEGGSENLFSSYTLTRTRSRSSSSSGSTVSEDNLPISPSRGFRGFQHPLAHQHSSTALDESFADVEAADESRDLPAVGEISQQQRPLSSISLSSRYKTPGTGLLSLSTPPPRRTSVPPVQPLPNFETPSTFADPQRPTSVPAPSAFTSVSYVAPSSSRDLPPQIWPSGTPYRNLPATSRPSATPTLPPRPPSRVISDSLEHAMENMQAHLAALTERVDTLESSFVTRSQSQAHSSASSRVPSGRVSPTGLPPVSQPIEWDIDDMGLWALILRPLLWNLSFVRRLLVFFLTSDQNRSPVLVVVKRLCLDISFVMAVLAVLRTVWTKSGTRRREVAAALVVLWGAITGRKGILGGKR